MKPEGSILVTGGAGFVGSHLVDFLLQKYDSINIVVLDKLTYAGSIENLEQALNTGRLRVLIEDVADVSACVAALYGIQTVIHLAAESHVDRSFQDPLPFIHSNVAGTQSLVEAARKCGVQTFIYCSTDEVYGESNNAPLTEESPYKPSNPYAASKAAAETILHSYKVAFGMDIRIVRPNNIIGTRQHEEKLIPKFTSLAYADRDLTIHGTGEQVRSFLVVSDFCRAIDTILLLGATQEIYNVGTDDNYTVNAIAQVILDTVRPHTAKIRYVTDRPYNDQAYHIDTTKIRKIGWQPQANVQSALSTIVDWYRTRCFVEQNGPQIRQSEGLPARHGR